MPTAVFSDSMELMSQIKGHCQIHPMNFKMHVLEKDSTIMLLSIFHGLP